MKRILFAFLLVMASSTTLWAQRTMDKLSRGLIATVTQSGSGNFVSWRVLGDEYYDVTYNLYADGALIARNLYVSNYVHSSGTATTKYTVAPVVKGVEGKQCDAVTRFANSSYYSLTGQHTGYIRIAGATMTGRDGSDLTSNYEFNDVVLADLDGDGMPEIIAKRLYTGSPGVTDKSDTIGYNRIEAYTISGTRLWSIDIGPNMQSGPDEQFDAIAFDWDGDGKAEVLMRGADNMIIHHPDGTTTNIGDMTYDVRKVNNTQYSMPKNEYLLYMEGTTAKPYAIGDNDALWIPYPAKQLESGESSWSDAWGDGTGHRATKHYFGAPYLDGHNPSIFIGRGCYTRHKFYAFDVDPLTHKLTERWHWLCNTGGPWYGQGYHNFAIADVDMDGRDEIMFGSMTIDDNGYGLSTVGLGHGDAQHCGDLDPYRWGLEQFACNETSPSMNYRNATTSELYFRQVGTGDDGRALAGNFTNDYPGCVGRSTQVGIISCVADKAIPAISDLVAWGDLNFRIYWDGDLCDEVLNSPGTMRQAKIEKPGTGRIFLGELGAMNNNTKNDPCATGDLFGDWREELLLRDGTGLVIYTSNYPTNYRIPTLWHDHQYRQGMVWETIGYNQPPHTSFFLGEMEGITVAPPPLTTEGRTQIDNGGSIASAHNGLQVLAYDNADTKITVESGAQPWVAFFNVPSWVQGTAASECSTQKTPINYEYYTCTVDGAAFSGTTRLVKQGEGTLILPTVAETYTGNTDVWGGTLQFDGTLLQSRLWLNRFTTLSSNGGQFRSIHADYAATVQPGGKDNVGLLTVDTLALGFGARLQIDLDGETKKADLVNVNTVLSIETKDWEYGPKYLRPILEFNVVNDADTVPVGVYDLGAVKTIKGNISNLIIEGLSTKQSHALSYEDGHIYLTIGKLRDATSILWNGATSDVWDFATTPNWTLAADTAQKSEIFVSNDVVNFTDDAQQFEVDIRESVSPDSVIVDNEANAYTFTGDGFIDGDATFVKRGAGTVTISTDNTYTGGTRLSGGTTKVSALSNATTEAGNLGGVTISTNRFIMENGAVLQNTADVTMGSPMQMVSDEGGVILNNFTFNMNKSIIGTQLTKKGSGWMNLYSANSSLKKLIIAAGTVQPVGNVLPAQTVEFQGGTLTETGGGSSFTINVPEGKTGTWNLTGIATYSNKLTGEGTLTVYMPSHPNYEGVTRTPVTGNWSAFTGTVNLTTYSTNVPFTFDNSNGLANATVNIQEDRTVCNTSGKTFRIGKLTGTGNLGGVVIFRQGTASGTCTWQIGNDENWSWGGKVTGSCALTKMGSGKVSLTNKNHDFTSALRVQEGELHFGSGVVLGTGSINVASGATLSGASSSSAPLTNSSTTINGTLQPGIIATSTSGFIDFGEKNVTFSKTGILRLGVRRCATASSTGGAYIQGINKLTMNGTVSVFVPESHTLQVGDSVILWKASSFTGTPKLESEVIDEVAGLYWDASRLDEGLLFVTDQNPTAISGITTSEQSNVQVVNAAGVVVANYTTTADKAVERLHQSDLPDGVYMLRISTASGTRTLKVRK